MQLVILVHSTKRKVLLSFHPHRLGGEWKYLLWVCVISRGFCIGLQHVKICIQRSWEALFRHTHGYILRHLIANVKNKTERPSMTAARQSCGHNYNPLSSERPSLGSFSARWPSQVVSARWLGKKFTELSQDQMQCFQLKVVVLSWKSAIT